MRLLVGHFHAIYRDPTNEYGGQNQMRRLIVLVAASVCFVAGCAGTPTFERTSSDAVPAGATRGDLVEAIEVGSLSAGEIASFVEVEGGAAGSTERFAQHDVMLHQVSYVSTYAGEVVLVSGLVIVPVDAGDRLDIFQHHHGTIIPGDDEEVPSSYRGGAEGSSEMYFIGATAASAGYVVSMPDYAGYGVSADLEHPYTVHAELAATSVDMLRAASQLMADLGLDHSGDVMLTGWSEGGGAGLATHQLIESTFADEFDVRASSLLAGPYDYSGFFQALVDTPDKEQDVVSLFSWALYSLNELDDRLGRAPEELWSYDVGSQVDAVNVPELTLRGSLQPAALDGLADGSDATLAQVIADNSLVNGWVPQAPVFFHSGTADEIVLHLNSEVAHENFMAAGGDSTLYEYEGGDHFTPLVDYVITTLDDFAELG